MIDYLALLLVVVVAGFLLLAHFAVRGRETDDATRWAPGFALVGLILIVGGFSIVLTWPLPGSYNIAFGGPAVLFGGLLAAAALAFARGWGLTSLSVFALVAGAVAIVVGSRLIDLGLTERPAVAGSGFILSGVTGLMASAALWSPGIAGRRPWHWAFALVALAAAVIWAVTGFDAYWGHLASFAK